MSAPASALVAHISANPAAGSTILYIHGGFGNACEFFQMVRAAANPALNNYHLLAPSYHANSSTAFDLPSTVEAIAKLVRTKARNGHAHVASFSLGAHIALALAGKYSEMVDSLFMSGYNKPSAYGGLLPLAMWAGLRLGRLVESIATSSEDKAMAPATSAGEEVTVARVEDLNPNGLVPRVGTLQLCQEIMGTISEDVDRLGRWSESDSAKRTLFVAAGKWKDAWFSSLSNDDLTTPRILKSKIGKDCMVMRLEGYGHPWGATDPTLFVQTMLAWIDGSELGSKFTGC